MVSVIYSLMAFAIQSSYSTACTHACQVVWRCILTCEQIEAEPQRESEDSALARSSAERAGRLSI